MKWFFNQNNQVESDKELAVLAERLKQADLKPVLNMEQIEAGKANLLSLIAESSVARTNQAEQINRLRDLNLIEKIKNVSDEVVLSGYQVNYLRKNIFSQLGEVKPQLGWSNDFWKTFKTTVATFVLFVTGLSILAVAPLDPGLTKASKWTFLEDVRGEVYVNRGGQILAVDKEFALEEGDLLITRADSFVVVRFLDDSVARLGENTSLEVKKLYVSPENMSQTQIELSLIDGQAWTNVVNLIDENSIFVIETNQAKAEVSSRASFEIKTSDQATSIEVFDNVVDFVKKDGVVEEVKPVVSGYKATISTTPTYQLDLSDHRIVMEKNSGSSTEWTRLNQQLDKDYQVKLTAENQDFTKTALENRENFLGFLVDFQNKTKSIFLDTEIEDLRIKFIDAHLGLIKAQDLLTKLSAGNNTRPEALKLAYQYRTTVREIVSSLPKLREKSPEQAELLYQVIREHLDVQRKNLYNVLPDGNSYFIKDLLYETSFSLAMNDLERVEFHLQRAKTTLMEVQGLVDKEKIDLAASTFNKYLEGIGELVNLVNTANLDEVNQKFLEIIKAQVKQVKVFDSITAKLENKGASKLLDKLEEAKRASLFSLMDISGQYKKQGIPMEMLLEIKGMVESYVDDQADQELLIGKLEILLKDYPEYQFLLESKPVIPAVIPETTLGFDIENIELQESEELKNSALEIEESMEVKDSSIVNKKLN
jgi:hypothetical protein